MTIFRLNIMNSVHSHGPPGSRFRRERRRGRTQDRHERVWYRRTGHHRRVGQKVQLSAPGDQRSVQNALRKGMQ